MKLGYPSLAKTDAEVLSKVRRGNFLLALSVTQRSASRTFRMRRVPGHSLSAGARDPDEKLVSSATTPASPSTSARCVRPISEV